MEKYMSRIYELREAMSEEAQAAMREDRPVTMKFYELQTELLKTIRNCRAWCKRHNAELPAGI